MKPLFSKRTLGPGVRRVLLLAGPFLRRWARAGYFSGRLERPPERVLLLSCGGLTETLWAGQVVAPLLARYGRDGVWAACRQETAPIWHGWLGAERVHVLPRLQAPPSAPPPFAAVWEAAAPLRDGGYGVAFDLTGQRHTALLAFLSRPQRAFGFGGGELAGLYSAPPPATPPAAHLARRPWAAVAPLLGEPAHGAPQPPRVLLDPFPAAATVRAAVGLERRQPYAVLVPGGAAEPLRWPSTHYTALAERLEEELGLVPVAVGRSRERWLLEATVHRAAHGKIAADLPLPHLARLLEGARLVVGGDAPPVHLAAAFGAPVVALFNATDPQLRRPLGARVRVLATGCSHRAPEGDTDGMPRRACPTPSCWDPLPPARALAACRLQLLA